MQEHLRRLIDICSLSEPEQYLMMNLSLLPQSGVSKVNIKAWLQLPNLSDAIKLVKYGFIRLIFCICRTASLSMTNIWFMMKRMYAR